jgi:hypothetical protein
VPAGAARYLHPADHGCAFPYQTPEERLKFGPASARPRHHTRWSLPQLLLNKASQGGHPDRARLRDTIHALIEPYRSAGISGIPLMPRAPQAISDAALGRAPTIWGGRRLYFVGLRIAHSRVGELKARMQFPRGSTGGRLRTPRGLSYSVIEWSRLRTTQFVLLATELLTADVPVAAMALSEMGPPGEILGGFSFFGRGWRHRRCPSLFRVDAQAFPRPATTGQQPPCRRCARNAKRPVHHACGKGGKAIANVLRSTSGIASTNRRMRSMSLRSSE